MRCHALFDTCTRIPLSPTTTTTTEIIPAPLAKVIVKSEGICQKSSSTLDEDLTRLGETKLEEKEARAGPKVRGEPDWERTEWPSERGSSFCPGVCACVHACVRVCACHACVCVCVF